MLEASVRPGSTALLVLAVLVLGLGPLLHRVARGRPALLTLLDGFVLASVGALVVVFVLPPALQSGGAFAAGAAVVGLVLPTLLERWSARHRLVHRAGLLIALVGLLVHTLTDGVALASGSPDDYTLAAAVVLHRIPVGFAAWWLVRPLYGVAGATLVLFLEAAGTVVGFSVGGAQLDMLSGPALGVFQAFVAGTLLHVVVHRPAGAPSGAAGGRGVEAIGAVLGVALVLLVPHGHPGEDGHGLELYGERFLALALESAPALTLGYLLAGVIVVALPRASLGFLSRGNPLTQAARGVAFGIPIPICSCGVVPVYQSLLRRGVPPAAAMAFLVATPELGVESLLLSVPLLGGQLTAARLGAAVIVALAAGALVGARLRRGAAPVEEEVVEADQGGLLARAAAALRFGFVEVVDDTAAWILVGLAVAAAIEPASLSGWLASLPPGSDVVLAAFLGVPVYVCASGATPLAAALLAAGLSPGAALAFLLSGPATNITTFGVLSRLHGKASAVAFGACVTGVAIALGATVNLVLEPKLPGALLEGDEGASALAWLCLVGLALAWGAAVLRQGPRGFVAGVLSLGSGTEHEHDHDHGHGHGHGHEHEHECGSGPC